MTIALTDAISIRFNTSSEQDTFEHLKRTNNCHTPPLSKRVNLHDYAQKLTNHAERIELWNKDCLIGLIAYYEVDSERIFISNVSIDKAYRSQNYNQKFGSILLKKLIQKAQCQNISVIELSVFTTNLRALKFYEAHGFTETKNKSEDGALNLSLSLSTTKLVTERNMNRDYTKETRDNEGRKYAYNFDFDVMHKYMIQTFKPFLKPGNVLELGCFEGAFTKRLQSIFDDITCIEASKEAAEKVHSKIPEAIVINNTFEEVNLQDQYDNIVMTHVLEHIEDPVRVLKRVNHEWLANDGRFFLVCPNANAPSRQIAVKMGLISHNAAVTDAEAQHGHFATYTFDTLENVAKRAGLKIVSKQGIFFKALANFQWDKILQTDIVSEQYLDGCFELGQVYPDLCASICLVCEKG